MARKPRYAYKVDWFSEHVPAWEAVLLPRFGGRRDVRALVVDPYEGRCVVWLAERLAGARVTVLADFDAQPSCVGFRGTPVWNPDVERAFEHNMDVLFAASRADRLRLLRGDPTASLLRLRCEAADAADAAGAAGAAGADAAFDVVYVNCRSSKHAMESAVLALPLLAPGGVMVLTNNVHGRAHDAACPRRGIDGFLDAYVTDVRVLRGGFHLFVEKRARPIALPLPCRAEAYDSEAETFADPVCDEAARRAAAASDVHDAWVARNPGAGPQYAPYAELPAGERRKDLRHVDLAARALRRARGDADAAADAFAAVAHEGWRRTHLRSNGDVPRVKTLADGETHVDINVPWKKLHPERKRENLQAGHAAIKAIRAHSLVR
jgi:hypothetical protein